jgi:hypothetical protein
LDRYPMKCWRGHEANLATSAKASAGKVRRS